MKIPVAILGLVVTLCACAPAYAQTDDSYCLFRRTIAYDALNENALRNDWLRVFPCKGAPLPGIQAWQLYPADQNAHMTLAEAQALYDYILVTDDVGWQRDCSKQFSIWQKGARPAQVQLAVLYADQTAGSGWMLMPGIPAPKGAWCCEEVVDWVFANSDIPPVLPGKTGDCRRARLYAGGTGGTGGAMVAFTGGRAYSTGAPITITPPGNYPPIQLSSLPPALAVTSGLVPTPGPRPAPAPVPVPGPRPAPMPVPTPGPRPGPAPVPAPDPLPAPPAGGVGDPDAWQLVSVTSDPQKKSERRVQGNQEEVWALATGLYHWEFRQFDLSQDGKNTKLWVSDSESTFKFQAPPSQLAPGQKFRLTISASHVDRAKENYPGDARYDGAGCSKTSEAGRGTASWTIVFDCDVPQAPSTELHINQVGSGAGIAGAFRYCKGGRCEPAGRQGSKE
jgi:hypothetical protein